MNNIIKTAPTGAVFIWKDSNVSEGQQLVMELDRDDLIVVPPTVVGLRVLVGTNRSYILHDDADFSPAVDTLLYHHDKFLQRKSA